MKALRNLWDRLNGDRDDRDDFAERMDAAKARGVARRAGLVVFDPLPAMKVDDWGAMKLRGQNLVLVQENKWLTQRVKDLEEENAFFRAIF